MQPYDIRKAYDNEPVETIHQMYRDFEDKEATDQHNYDESLLHIAATHADAPAIEILLEAGLNPNVMNKYGRTALHSLAAQDFRSRYKVAEGDTYASAVKLLEARTSTLRKDESGDACLHIAARWGRAEFFQAMVDKGAKLDITDKKGNTALHIICRESGSAASSIKYAERNLNISLEDAKKNDHKIYRQRVEDNQARYDEEVKKFDGYFHSARIIIEAGLDVDEKNSYGETALDLLNGADREGDKRIAALIGGYYSEEDGGDSGLKMQTGGMSIHKSVEKGDYEALRAIIALGADLNELNECSDTPDRIRGLTPLGVAIVRMDAQAAEILLEAGADPNFKDGDGRTPMAAFYHIEATLRVSHKVFEEKRVHNILKAMKAKGLDVNGYIDDQLYTGLNRACRALDGASGYNSFTLPGVIIDAYLGWNADVNIPNSKGVTPLMHMGLCSRASAENYQISLLEFGADPAARDAEGNTPLMYTVRNRDKAMAKNMADMLFSLGNPEPEAVNNQGVSALEIATSEDNEPLVKYLLGKF